MRRQRSLIPWSLVWLGLLFFTLRPFGPMDALVDIPLAGLRVVGELASPMLVLRRQRVLAAESELRSTAADEERTSRELLADLAQRALPDEERLVRGRRLVHAEVLGHRDLDHLRVRLRDASGVQIGFPVACGNAYVGRIVEFEGTSARDVAIVQMVTAADFHVGGVVEQPQREQVKLIDAAFGVTHETSPVLMTVGGLATRRRRARGPAEIRLAVHNPSDLSLVGGLVRVHELFADQARESGLTDGLHLGRVQRDPEGLWITPELDYKDGLFQVVVLCPPSEVFGNSLAFDTAVRDSNWVRTRALTMADANPERSACKIRAGRGHGVRAGAAVTSIGAHLVGRVVRAGLLTSDVAFLDDPGFSIVAVARIDGVAEPRVLGRLVALGRDFADAPENGKPGIWFRWIVRVPLDVDHEPGQSIRRARLFTGSSDRGLPAGFSLGVTELPLDASPYTEPAIELFPDVYPSDVQTMFVRTISTSEEGDA